jgi:hypothetical protein
MVAYDKWNISAVLPGFNYEEYGEHWIIQIDSLKKKDKTLQPVVYHKHYVDKKGYSSVYSLYIVDKNNQCRMCGESCPLGILFRLKALNLKVNEGVNV